MIIGILSWDLEQYPQLLGQSLPRSEAEIMGVEEKKKQEKDEIWNLKCTKD